MGTRGAVGFRIDGQDKVTYNHFDSYPSGLGVEVLQNIHNLNVDDLKEAARHIQLIDGQTKPTADQKKRFLAFADVGVGEQSLDDWYCLLRNAQGTLQPYTEGLDVMIDSHGFLLDSLFCEYAYIVNFDDNVLEVYKGFNKDPKAGGRYAPQIHRGGYYGVSLIKTIPLDEIRATDDLDAMAESWEPAEVE